MRGVSSNRLGLEGRSTLDITARLNTSTFFEFGDEEGGTGNVKHMLTQLLDSEIGEELFCSKSKDPILPLGLIRQLKDQLSDANLEAYASVACEETGMDDLLAKIKKRRDELVALSMQYTSPLQKQFLGE